MLRKIYNIFEILIILLISLGFALGMDALVGWTFIYAVIFAILFSVFVMFGIMIFHSSRPDADVNSELLYKGETLTLTLSVNNKTFVPVPDTEFLLETPQGLVPEAELKDTVSITAATRRTEQEPSAERSDGNFKNIVSITTATRRAEKIRINYKAVRWGKSYVGAKRVTLRDFLDLFRFPVRFGNCKSKIFTIRVFPDIPEIPVDSPMLRSITTDLKFDNESEETVENKMFTVGGYPGYTHRDFQPGDPLKRINWKISAKRGKFSVRLDDETESQRQVIVLDSRSGGYDADERAVETTLGIVNALIKLSFRTSVWYCSGGVMNCFEAAESFDIFELQRIFADYEFAGGSDKSGRIPTEEIAARKQGSAVLFITPADVISDAVAEAKEYALRVAAVVCGDCVDAESAETVYNMTEGIND
ncbi:MAG: DUF58 domain-containing protein [Ruminococcus sp.]|jgi:uncharacterized protein (DUF58 family)|nr:DUF58 domain-containing protein [Ruminococcus sp.]